MSQEQPTTKSEKHTRIARLLPTPGNVFFTLLALAALVLASRAGVIALGPSAPGAPAVASTNTLPYQGRLANSSGAPITGQRDMTFKLYSAVSGPGAAIWSESWSNVQVTNGLFNVLLGTTVPINASIVANSSLWLGITVGSDAEMTPRVQLGAAPFAMSVPDGSITSAKLAADLYLPMVPRVLAYINKDNWLEFNSDMDGTPHTFETINFTLPAAPPGYRWDLVWHFNQRFGAISGQTTFSRFLLDGNVIKDSMGTPSGDNQSLSIQSAPTDNIIFGGMVYQNNVAPGTHTITWQIVGYGQPTDTFGTRQRWLMLTGLLVPSGF
jgi:hypothetical protein